MVDVLLMSVATCHDIFILTQSHERIKEVQNIRIVDIFEIELCFNNKKKWNPFIKRFENYK